MSRVDDYLKKAAEIDAIADGAVGGFRVEMRAIAKQWRTLAHCTGEIRENDPRLREPWARQGAGQTSARI